MAYAAVWGMRTETHLHGQQYSWLGSIFYLGYLAMEMPTVWLLTKVPLGSYIGGTLFAWGGVVCCMAACRNFAGLATVRFLLGVFEAGILPALLLVNSLWYTRREQPLRTALWYNTFAGVGETNLLSIKLELTRIRSLVVSSVLRSARSMVHCRLGRFESCSCVLPCGR
jgi:MFS family permease